MESTETQGIKKFTNAPSEFRNEVQKRTYQALAELGIPFERVDNKPAATMEECLEIEKILGVKVIKSLFLCNRQQTQFYLFMTEGDKPFSTKNFGHALNISRVSFAPEEKLRNMMGVEFGATTLFSLLMDTDKKVRFIVDKDVLTHEYISIPDGTVTCYMKVPAHEAIEKIAALMGHDATIIEV